jgi:site-specific DNA recombinase
MKNKPPQSSPMGKFMLTVMASMAQLERDQTAERTQAVIDLKKAKGEKTGGDLPFGYQLAADGKTLEENPVERKILKDIRHLRMVDGLSMRKIVEELNKRGAKARGKKWHLKSVHRIVRRED